MDKTFCSSSARESARERESKQAREPQGNAAVLKAGHVCLPPHASPSQTHFISRDNLICNIEMLDWGDCMQLGIALHRRNHTLLFDIFNWSQQIDMEANNA